SFRASAISRSESRRSGVAPTRDRQHPFQSRDGLRTVHSSLVYAQVEQKMQLLITARPFIHRFDFNRSLRLIPLSQPLSPVCHKSLENSPPNIPKSARELLVIKRLLSPGH